MIQTAILIGSESDRPVMAPCTTVLDKLGIKYCLAVASAHRTPKWTAQLIADLENKGCQVFICGAGMAAHLAGAVASRTIRPVLGVPINASSLSGWDALLSTVQMPPGYPVGAMALDQAGAKNSAWMAAQILALHDFDLAKRIAQTRDEIALEVEKSNQGLF